MDKFAFGQENDTCGLRFNIHNGVAGGLHILGLPNRSDIAVDKNEIAAQRLLGSDSAGR